VNEYVFINAVADLGLNDLSLAIEPLDVLEIDLGELLIVGEVFVSLEQQVVILALKSV